MKRKSLYLIQEYLQKAHDDAEARHDQGFEFSDYEEMQVTESLIEEIDLELDTLQSKDETE